MEPKIEAKYLPKKWWSNSGSNMLAATKQNDQAAENASQNMHNIAKRMDGMKPTTFQIDSLPHPKI